MKKLFPYILALGLFTGCGGGSSSNQEIISGEGTLSDPIVLDNSEILIDTETFYRYNMPAANCKLLLIPDSPLIEVASYNKQFAKTKADLRIDSNYVVTSTQSDTSILVKIMPKVETEIKIVSNCDGQQLPQIAQDFNEAGLTTLTPIYEDAFIYLAGEKKVFVYDKDFAILNDGQFFIHTNPRGQLNYYYSDGPFTAAFASDSVGL